MSLSPSPSSSREQSHSSPAGRQESSVTRSTSSSTTRCNILSLPPEIVHHLSSYLDPAGVVAFKLTCRTAFVSTPVNIKPTGLSLTICARSAIRRHVEEALEAPGRFRCALCKALYPKSLFEKAACLDAGQTAIAQAQSNPADDVVGLNCSLLTCPEKTPDLKKAGSKRKRHEHSPSTSEQRSSPRLPSHHNIQPGTGVSGRICNWHSEDFVIDCSFEPHRDILRSPTRSNKEQWSTMSIRWRWASAVEQVCMHCGFVICATHLNSPAHDACMLHDSFFFGGARAGRVRRCRCEADCDACGIRAVRTWYKVPASVLEGDLVVERLRDYLDHHFRIEELERFQERVRMLSR